MTKGVKFPQGASGNETARLWDARRAGRMLQRVKNRQIVRRWTWTRISKDR